MVTRPLTPVEADLFRMLGHAMGCDGHACRTCDAIYLRLQDGLPHAREDVHDRITKVESMLTEIIAQSERVYEQIEGSPIPSSSRRSFAQILEWLIKTRAALRLPILKSGASPPLRRWCNDVW